MTCCFECFLDNHTQTMKKNRLISDVDSFVWIYENAYCIMEWHPALMNINTFDYVEFCSQLPISFFPLKRLHERDCVALNVIASVWLCKCVIMWLWLWLWLWLWHSDRRMFFSLLLNQLICFHFYGSPLHFASFASFCLFNFVSNDSK